MNSKPPESALTLINAKKIENALMRGALRKKNEEKFMKLTGKIQSELKGFSKEIRLGRPNKSRRTWILVADHHIARLFEKGEKGLISIGEASPDTAAKTEISNKSVGRVASSGGGGVHHKYEPHMNESRHDSLAFVYQLSEWLNKSVWEGAFDRLVLIAAPQALGELRKTLKQPVQARIIAEINKDLTKMNERDLLEELTKIIWF